VKEGKFPPLFAQPWVQKLAYYANLGRCDRLIRFQRIVGVFRARGSRGTRSCASSSRRRFTTYASPTTTASRTARSSPSPGAITSVPRSMRASDSRRLRSRRDDEGRNADDDPEIVSAPSDGYGRGSIAPVLPNQPPLLSRGTENICERGGAHDRRRGRKSHPGVTSGRAASRPPQSPTSSASSWRSLERSGATPAQSILAAHYAAAIQGGRRRPTR